MSSCFKNILVYSVYLSLSLYVRPDTKYVTPLALQKEWDGDALQQQGVYYIFNWYFQGFNTLQDSVRVLSQNKHKSTSTVAEPDVQ